MDTTLPNIADRWKEVAIPICKDRAKQTAISNKVENLIKNHQWHFLQEISKLKETEGVYYT